MDLELVLVGMRTVHDGEFVVETGYLLELDTGEIYAEKAITPSRMWRSSHRVAPPGLRIVVAEAGLYPGPSPRRIRLKRWERGTLTVEHITRLLTHATTDARTLARRVADRLEIPVSEPEVAVFVRIERVGHLAEHLYGVDAPGNAIPLMTSDHAMNGSNGGQLRRLLTAPPPLGLFGLVTHHGGELALDLLGAVTDRPVGGEPPIHVAAS
jgi:hypothetical protein